MLRSFFLIVLFVLTLFTGVSLAWDYRIGCGDLLAVSVWAEPDLSVEAIVRPDGKITIPAAGDFVAVDKTPSQLSKDIQSALGKFVKRPVVTVAVTQITNNKTYISGGGVPSQVVNLPGQTGLFKLLCTLEGLENVNLRQSYLLREGEKILTDFHDLFINSDLSKDMVLQPEDIVFLPSNQMNRVYVLGSVREPKPIPYFEGMRVLDAIFAAGGLDEFATKSHIVLLRGEDEALKLRTKELLNGESAEQNIELLPGDYLYIKDSLF